MPNSFKTALRNTIKHLRSKVSPAYCAKSSELICNHICNLGYYRQAKRIGLYSAIHQEIDLTLLWHRAAKERKQCYFPKMNQDKSLSFYHAKPGFNFKKNSVGILEPDINSSEEGPVPQLDLVIMPIIAFDSACNRIGMGAGYYDRTFSQPHKAVLIGVGYSFQHTDFISAESWDIPLDVIVTPQKIYWRETKS